MQIEEEIKEFDPNKTLFLNKILQLWQSAWPNLNYHKFMEKLAFEYHAEQKELSESTYNHVYNTDHNGVIRYEGSMVDMANVKDEHFVNWLDKKLALLD
ncbi:hypothetical protein [Shouchella clausii]|uniref:hypothetical protein n=1 Tax=Shouchella clausii TaxID=79880 RepID=UPI001C73355A|nr:hypothetical protein [Shouchella clausii]MBX0320224.1 hypothetical protein [Shouchella clausii]